MKLLEPLPAIFSFYKKAIEGFLARDFLGAETDAGPKEKIRAFFFSAVIARRPLRSEGGAKVGVRGREMPVFVEKGAHCIVVFVFLSLLGRVDRVLLASQA